MDFECSFSIQKLHLKSIYLSELLNLLNKPLFWVWPTSYMHHNTAELIIHIHDIRNDTP